MKKLSEQDVEKIVPHLALSSSRNGLREAVRQEIKKLNIGEALQITTAEWPGKTHPSNNLARLTKSLGVTLKIRALADKSGWVIQRIS